MHEIESEEGSSVPTYSQQYLKYLSLYEGFEFYVTNYMGRNGGLAGSLDIRALYGYFDFDIGESINLERFAGSNDMYPIGIMDLTGINGKCRLWRQAKRLSDQNNPSCTTYLCVFMATDDKIYSYCEGLTYRHADSIEDFIDRLSRESELYRINPGENIFNYKGEAYKNWLPMSDGNQLELVQLVLRNPSSSSFETIDIRSND